MLIYISQSQDGMREWRNWQTRMIQVHVYVRTCRFKSCFPHQTKTLEKSRVFAIFGGPKTGFECNYECNWSRLTPILAGIGWDYFFIFKKIFSCLIFSTVYPTHTQSPPLWSNCRAQRKSRPENTTCTEFQPHPHGEIAPL